jgi:acyl-CoA synthetase (AMP-forming)/AMP-acid ligase II
MGELIERNAAWYPKGLAYVAGDRRLTYGDFARRSRRVATMLHQLGVRRQDRVGMLAHNCLEYAELYGACEWAGYMLALYNYRSASPELAWLLEDSSPTVVIFEAQYADMIAGLRGTFPGVRGYVCIGNPRPDWAVDYETLVAEADESGPPFRSEPDDFVYLFYTSGTTGRPKGVPYRHRGALIMSERQGRQCGPDLRVLQITPMFHIGGKGFACGAAWMAGTTVLERQFDPLRFLQTVQGERITFTFMVAPMIQAVLDHPQFAEFNLSSLRAIMSASGPIPVPLLRRAIARFGPLFYIAYGSTEASGVCVLERHELRPAGTPKEIERLASVGHFSPEVEGVILDDTGQRCAQGDVGEICVRSPVFEGYWNNTMATIEATRSGWLHTGDLGYLDEEGYVFLVDRKKDMIISGGENIYSREVEEALHRHPSVLEAAVIGVPHPKWVETVKAIVVLRTGQSATESELIAFCQMQIARYKCPKSISVVSELPRLASGKVDKVFLRKQHNAVA